MGPSLRVVVGALLAGTGVFARALLVAGAKRYYLSGFEKMTARHREYITILALASQPAEALTKDILADDRLARRPDHYAAILRTSLEELAETPVAVFECLSPMVGSGEPARALMSRCLQAAEASAAYVDLRVFAELRSSPWTLARGDIEENLTRLRDDPALPRHPMAAKLQTLMRASYSLPELKQTVELLRLVRWSTNPVEQ